MKTISLLEVQGHVHKNGLRLCTSILTLSPLTVPSPNLINFLRAPFSVQGCLLFRRAKTISLSSSVTFNHKTYGKRLHLFVSFFENMLLSIRLLISRKEKNRWTRVLIKPDAKQSRQRVFEKSKTLTRASWNK